MQSDADLPPSYEEAATAAASAPKSLEFVPVQNQSALASKVGKYTTLVEDEEDPKPQPQCQEASRPAAGSGIPELPASNMDGRPNPDRNLPNPEIHVALRCPACRVGILQERDTTWETLKCIGYALCCVLLLFAGRICIYIPGEQGQYKCSNCKKSFNLVQNPNRVQR